MRKRSTLPAAWLAVLFALCAGGVLHADRRLHWDALDVEARLDADGVLHVTETHTMVFTGDWNGGERIFDVRPRQDVFSVTIGRLDPVTRESIPMRRDDRLDDVDDAGWPDGRTLRWRSRLASDPPFANERLMYVIGYRTSGILRYENDRYLLDHDFAFPNREGRIEKFSLHLTLDPAWQPMKRVEERYAAGPLRPGRSFIVKLPLRYTGGGTPVAIDTRRSPEIRGGVAAIFAIFALAVSGLFIREFRLGRFEPVSRERVDAQWIADNIIVLPAEVVGAAWDGNIGPPEVVALIARLVQEGKLSSETRGSSMMLTLNVDRASLKGHELALVNALFFDGRTVTSTDMVRQHYASTGFDPAGTIAPELKARVNEVLPPAKQPRRWRQPSAILFLCALSLLVYVLARGSTEAGAVFMLPIAALVALIGKAPGRSFRRRIDWGVTEAVACLIPALLIVAAAAAFLWFGAPDLELAAETIAVFVAMTAWAVHKAVDGLKSREAAAAIAFRKKLAAGRQYFVHQLRQARPALQDGWYPWVLAFGLAKEADRWSARSAAMPASEWRDTDDSRDAASATPAWTGFAGGRSGGAGGGAVWAAAAAGMAAGVATRDSDGGGGSSSGSSDSGSSGGGGGGGW